MWVIPEAGDEPEMIWRRNPRLVVSPGAMHAVRLYYQHKGGMAPGPLPDAGGVNGQAAWLMAAFNLLAAIEDAWQKGREE